MPLRSSASFLALSLVASLFSAFDAAAAKAPVRQRLAVAWTDAGGHGAVAAMRTKPPFTFLTEVLTIDPEPQLRFANGFLYAVSRPAGTITIINPRKWTIERVLQLGANSQPIDIAVVNTRRAYVTRANATQLLRLNLRTGAGENVGDFSRVADSDGVPDFGTMVRQGDRLFVQIRRLNDAAPGGFEAPAGIAIVDLDTELLIDGDRSTPGPQAIPLQGTWPKLDMQLVRSRRMLVVNASGGFFDAGGIERIDLETLTSQGFEVAEADGNVGADLGAFLMTCRESGYLTYSTDLLLSSHLHRFSFTSGVAPAELSVSLDYEAPVLEHVTRQRRLFVPRADGVAVFDSRTGAPLLAQAVPTPAPPSDIALLRPRSRRTAQCPGQ